MPTKWRTYLDHRFCDVTSPYLLVERLTYMAKQNMSVFQISFTKIFCAMTNITYVTLFVWSACTFIRPGKLLCDQLA